MPERNIASESLLGSSASYIKGDYDPSEFSYTNALSRDELLSLFLRNPKIQKATAWFAGEILRERWIFKQDQSIVSEKHGQPYTFPTFNEWLEWNGFIQEVLKGLTWSLLFGDAILVFYDGLEHTATKYKGSKSPYFEATTSTTGYISCKAYYPFCRGNGYSIEKADEFWGTPEVYKIQLKGGKSTTNTYFVDAARVVRFPAPQKELKYGGSSNVAAIAHDCLAQEQIKRAVVTQANNLLGGILALKASNEDEKAIVDSAIGDTLTHLRRVYYKNADEVDDLMRIIVPDLKIDQLEQLNKVIQTDIATGMDMSISILEGAPQGALSSAGFDTMNTYAKVYQLQSHYTRPFEECFFKLGKTDTTFTWVDPIGANENDRNRPTSNGTQPTSASNAPDAADSTPDNASSN